MPSAWSSDVCRSEEHTSELQSHDNLVCRLLLEKKNSQRWSLERPAAHARARQATDCARPLRRAPWRVPAAHSAVVRPREAFTFIFFFNVPGPPESSTFSPPAPLRI